MMFGNRERLKMTRKSLPQRRQSELVSFHFNGNEYIGGYSVFKTGTPAEVFVSPKRRASDIDIAACDMALLLSLALQYGMPIETASAGASRNSDGTAAGLLAALIDAMAG